jgi:hypothetical protein
MTTRPMPSAGRWTLLAVLACAACIPASAAGAPRVALQAALLPERLGAGTTIEFAFGVAFADHEKPVPVRVIQLRYPAHLGIATSGLGLSTCSAQTLEDGGPPGCPAESVMGYGSGLAEVSVGHVTLYEPVKLTTFMAPVRDGHLGLLFFADGEEPVAAEVVIPGVVLPSQAPFGGDLTTSVPLVPTWPEGPDVVLTRFSTTLGPGVGRRRVTYWEYSRGRYIPYHPRGVILPRRCPRGAFPFAATLTFENGKRSRAHTVVPCPHGGSAPRGA